MKQATQLLTHPGSDILLELYKLDQLRIKYAWTQEQWNKLDASNLVLTLEQADQLAAFCLIQSNDHDEVVHLLKIASRDQGQGHGKKLVEDLKNWARSNAKKTIYLEVEVGNTRAVEFYQRLNFEKLHQQKSFYSDGEDAYIMQCLL